MITPEVIPIIEKAFGFQLYDWQKNYILGRINHRAGGRRNGNTFAYCLRLLLSDEETIKRRELYQYADEVYGAPYPRWFAGYCIEIDKVLKDSGLKTRLID